MIYCIIMRTYSVIIPLNRNEFLGLAGMVTLNDSQDGFNGISMTNTLHIATQDIVDNGKRFLLYINIHIVLYHLYII